MYVCMYIYLEEIIYLSCSANGSNNPPPTPPYASVSAIYELQQPSRATSRQLRKLRYQRARSADLRL